MMNCLPIQSLLYAQESQFISLYEENPPNQYTCLGFINEYQEKQAIARKDQEELNALGSNAQEISENLQNLIIKANQAYQTLYGKLSQSDLFIKNVKKSIEVDALFKVSGLDVRAMRNDVCPICDFIVSEPVTYEIENLTTHENVFFPQLTSHLIASHDYFGKLGHYRLEPSKIYRILGLTKIES